jgi:hypothetical protein
LQTPAAMHSLLLAVLEAVIDILNRVWYCCCRGSCSHRVGKQQGKAYGTYTLDVTETRHNGGATLLLCWAPTSQLTVQTDSVAVPEHTQPHGRQPLLPV